MAVLAMPQKKQLLTESMRLLVTCLTPASQNILLLQLMKCCPWQMIAPSWSVSHAFACSSADCLGCPSELPGMLLPVPTLADCNLIGECHQISDQQSPLQSAPSFQRMKLEAKSPSTMTKKPKCLPRRLDLSKNMHK